jgi:hypothetical protein
MAGTKTDFAGRDGFHWWVGEVEDHMDPAQLGRVKVRIIGWYTGNRTKDGASSYLQDLPTKQLPWATVLLPTDRPQVKNAGSTTELQPGAQVLGFFLDGEEAQLPCVLGAFRGFRHAENSNESGASGSERGSANEMARTMVADATTANENVTDTPQQKDFSNQFSFGGAPFTKHQGQQPGSSEGGEEHARGAISRAEAESPKNVFTNPIGVPAMPGGIANGVDGPANEGFELDLRRMLTEIGVTIGSLVRNNKSGDFMSMITGRVIEGKSILNQISNLTNYLSNGISGILAPLKELAARVIQKVIDTILTVLSNILPLIVIRLIGEILDLIFQLFCKPTPEWVDIIKDVMGYVTNYLNSLFDKIMDFITEIEAKILAMVDKAVAAIKKAICRGLNAINRAADLILSAVSVAKAAAKAADVVSSIFKVDFTKINWTSILSILKAILSLIVGLRDCGRKTRKPRAKQWLPLLGTTECDTIGDAVKGPGGSDCLTDAPSSTGTFYDDFFRNINPFLAEVKMYLNGTREINDATPGKEKRIVSGPGAVTSFEDKRGNTHTNVPNNETKIVGRDMCYNVKNNLVHTIEGDYYLKVMGDFHIEVNGSVLHHESNGPGAKAKDENGGFKSGSSWLDQGADDDSDKITINSDGTAGNPRDNSFSGGVGSGSGGSNTSATPKFNVKIGDREAKSTRTIQGDHDVRHIGDYKIQANRINLTGIHSINLKAQEINNQCATLSNEAHGEIINETNWITSFLNCGRFDWIAQFQFMPVFTGQYSIVKGTILDLTTDLPFPGITPPNQVRIGIGMTMPTAMVDLLSGSNAGMRMEMVTNPTGGIGEIVTSGFGSNIIQVTSGIMTHGVGTGFSSFGTALGPCQIYGLPLLLN